MKQTLYRSADLENKIAAALRGIENKVIHAAQTLVFATEGDVLAGFRAHHDEVRALHGTIDYTLQTESNRHATEKGTIAKDRTEQRLEQEIAQAKERELNLSGYANNGASRKTKRILLTTLLVMLCMSDIIFNQRGMERLLLVNQLTGFLLSCMFAGGLVYCSHSWVPKALSKGNPKIKAAIAYGLSGCVFVFLGYARIADTFHFSLSNIVVVLAFALISELLFIAACRIGIHLMATENTTEMDQAEQAYKELQQVRKNLARMERERSTGAANWQNHEAYTLALAEYGEGIRMNCTNKVQSLFWEYIRIAKKHNPQADQSIFNFTEYPFSFENVVRKMPGIVTKGIVTVCIALVMAVSACTEKPQTPSVDMAVYTLVDASVPQEIYPDTASLVRLMGLSSEQWDISVDANFSIISDKDFEPSFTHRLQPQGRLFGNIVERQRELQTFVDGMQQSLQKVIPSPGTELKHSIVYRSVARKAIELSKASHKRKVLLVYSDLMNHDGSVSLYGKDGKRLLRKPETLETQFLAQVPLPDLTGVEIFFIHRPSDFSKNDAYRASSEFFSGMFSRHGATTYITADTP